MQYSHLNQNRGIACSIIEKVLWTLGFMKKFLNVYEDKKQAQ